MHHRILVVAASLLASSIPAFATIFAILHGVVHYPQHRPLAGAHIVLHATDSAFSLTTSSNSNQFRPIVLCVPNFVAHAPRFHLFFRIRPE
jgi:hypothetical protein